MSGALDSLNLDHASGDVALILDLERIVSELMVEASALAASSFLRPPLLPEAGDPVRAWHEEFTRLVAPREPHLLKAVSFSIIQSCTDAIFPSCWMHEPRLIRYSNALWVRGHGALYDGITGLALPGTFLTRFPYQREAPACSEFRVEITCPADAFDRLDRAVLIPGAHCGDFGHFITETMAFLWPLFSGDRSEFEGAPVILRGCNSAESSASILYGLLREAHAFPVLERDLPTVVCLKEVVVPGPTVRLRAGFSPIHLRTLSGLAQYLSAADLDAESVPSESPLVYLSRSGLGPQARRVDQEEALEALLSQMGWLIFRPELHSLSMLIRVVRGASVLAGFEGSALHALGCVDQGVRLPALILLGDDPSPDYFLQFRAQKQPGFFVQCTRLDPSSDWPVWMRPRLLNCAAESLAKMIHDLAMSAALDARYQMDAQVAGV